MQRLLDALDRLDRGEWDEAHRIAQDDPSPMGAWLHGIVHLAEPDESNAQYWYRRAGRPFPGLGAVASESAALRQAIGQNSVG